MNTNTLLIILICITWIGIGLIFTMFFEKFGTGPVSSRKTNKEGLGPATRLFLILFWPLMALNYISEGVEE